MNWTPETVISDGIFMIRTNPIPHTKMPHYISLLLARHVIPNGASDTCSV